jgi:hypothetical protein
MQYEDRWMDIDGPQLLSLVSRNGPRIENLKCCTVQCICENLAAPVAVDGGGFGPKMMNLNSSSGQ